jgi:hypothetical protein
MTPGLEAAAPALPAGTALAAVGIAWASEVPCSGYYVDGAKVAEQVISLLRDTPTGRPATLWMAGELVDRGTLGAGSAGAPAHAGSTLATSSGVLV